jgi:hypothetical protein
MENFMETELIELLQKTYEALQEINVAGIHSILAGYISSVGTLLMGVAAIIAAIKASPILKNIFSKDECLFGDEAKERYEYLNSHLMLPAEYPYFWGPVPWEGNQDSNLRYMLEIKKISYDPKTMGSEWKGCNKSIRYVYRENGCLMVKGWRMKK